MEMFVSGGDQCMTGAKESRKKHLAATAAAALAMSWQVLMLVKENNRIWPCSHALKWCSTSGAIFTTCGKRSPPHMKHRISCAPPAFSPSTGLAFSGASRQCPVTPEHWVAPRLPRSQVRRYQGVRQGRKVVSAEAAGYGLLSVTKFHSKRPQLSCPSTEWGHRLLVCMLPFYLIMGSWMVFMGFCDALAQPSTELGGAPFPFSLP